MLLLNTLCTTWVIAKWQVFPQHIKYGIFHFRQFICPLVFVQFICSWTETELYIYQSIDSVSYLISSNRDRKLSTRLQRRTNERTNERLMFRQSNQFSCSRDWVNELGGVFRFGFAIFSVHAIWHFICFHHLFEAKMYGYPCKIQVFSVTQP